MDKPKRILFLYDFLSEAGGVERIILNQVKALQREGHEVVLSFAFVDDNLRFFLEGLKIVENSRLPFHKESLQVMWSFVNPFLSSHLKKFDLIIAHSFISSFICSKTRVPYAIVLHHPPNFLYDVEKRWVKDSTKRLFAYWIGKLLGWPLKKIDKFSVDKTPLTFVDSLRTKKRTDLLYKPKGVLNYPAIQGKFKILDNPERKIESDYILAGGRIIRDKRFDYLIKIMSKVNKSVKLVLAGQIDDLYKEELTQLAKDLGVRDRVILYGQAYHELVDMYNLSKVNLLSCPMEDFGLMVVEPMACGTPVVAWGDNAGPNEVIKSGINGFLAEPYDLGDFAKKVNLALEKKWDKEEIRASVKEFTAEVQSKIFVDYLKKYFP